MTADTIWIGVAPTWEEMMEAAETMTTEEGQKIQAKFDRISDCYDHTGWGLEIVRASQELGGGLATTQWCTLNEGVTPDQVLAADKKIYALIEEEISKVNEQLPDNIKIAKFLLLFKELEADDGELTRTKKVRRSVINSRYKDIIKDIYLDKDTASIDTEFTLEDGRKSKISATMEIRHLIDTKTSKTTKAKSKANKLILELLETSAFTESVAKESESLIVNV